MSTETELAAVAATSEDVGEAAGQMYERRLNVVEQLQEVETPEGFHMLVLRGRGKLVVFDPPIIARSTVSRTLLAKRVFYAACGTVIALGLLTLLFRGRFPPFIIGFYSWQGVIWALVFLVNFKHSKGCILEMCENGFRSRWTFRWSLPTDFHINFKSRTSWHKCFDQPTVTENNKCIFPYMGKQMMADLNLGTSYTGLISRISSERSELDWLVETIKETQQELRFSA